MKRFLVHEYIAPSVGFVILDLIYFKEGVTHSEYISIVWEQDGFLSDGVSSVLTWKDSKDTYLSSYSGFYYLDIIDSPTPEQLERLRGLYKHVNVSYPLFEKVGHFSLSLVFLRKLE